MVQSVFGSIVVVSISGNSLVSDIEELLVDVASAAVEAFVESCRPVLLIVEVTSRRSKKISSMATE